MASKSEKAGQTKELDDNVGGSTQGNGIASGLGRGHGWQVNEGRRTRKKENN